MSTREQNARAASITLDRYKAIMAQALGWEASQKADYGRLACFSADMVNTVWQKALRWEELVQFLQS